MFLHLKQPPDVNLSKHAVDEESSNINSNILKKEEQNEVHAENNISSKLHVDLHIKRSDGPVKIEVGKAMCYMVLVEISLYFLFLHVSILTFWNL